MITSLRRRVYLGWALAAIGLAGCSGQPTPTPAPPASATIVVPAAVQPTATPPPPTRSPVPPSPTATATPHPETVSPASAPPSPTAAGPTATPLPDIALVVDNRDPTFATEGTWFVGDGGQSFNGDCAWAPRGVQNIAHVRPDFPVAGAYEVSAWWCGDPNHDHSRRVLVEIYPAAGQAESHPVHVNLQENAGRWNSLGTYWLEPGGSLSLHGNLTGNVVADAFRFAYRSPDALHITPTPLPTPVVWTGHPPSPLEQVTSGDLSARLGLVQRFYPYTPINSAEPATFDDCQAFPRDGCGGTVGGWRVLVEYQDLLVGYRVSQDYALVTIESPGALADRQLLYAYGVHGGRFFRVDRYPDGSWHLSGADFGGTSAAHAPLDATVVDAWQPFLERYGTVSFETAEGLKLTMYGLGDRVRLSEADRGQLAALAAQMETALWP